MGGSGGEVFAGGEIGQQAVNVPQVAQAARQVAIGQHVRGGVADAVGGGEDPQAF